MKSVESIRLTRRSTWTDFYDTEEELLSDMFRTKSNEKTDRCYYWQLVKGYGYIDSFKRYYSKHA